MDHRREASRTPESRNKGEETRIYVNNLPDELDEDGITQLFEAYGEVSSVLWPRGAKYAYVGFKTYREAEQAIRGLNGRKPLDLKVVLSTKKPRKEERIPHLQPDNGVANDHPDYSARIAAPLEIPSWNRPVTPARKIMPETFAQVAHYPNFNHGLEPTHEAVYPADLDYNMYNPYESVGRYADTNAMWSRGCVNVDRAGRRYVSLGRGYTRYHIPDLPSKIEDALSRVHEIRQSGFYQYGDDMLRSDVGKCQYCANVTKMCCEKCNGFYCSRECQIIDFPRHKMICRSIPNLVGDPEIGSLSRSSSEECLLIPRRPTGVDLRPPGPLRRPKRIALPNSKIVPDPKPQNDQTVDLSEPAEREAEPTREEVRNDVGKTNSATEIDSPQAIPREDSIQNNGSNPTNDEEGAKAPPGEPKNSDFSDQSRNDHRSNGNAIDRPNRPQRDNRAIGNLHSDEASVPSSARSGPKEPRKIASRNSRGSLSSLTKEDLLKIEEQITFQRDCRPNSIENRAKIDCSSGEIVATLEASPTEAPLLSKEEFTPAIVVVDMPDGTFWIHREIDVDEFGAMMLELNEKADGYPRVSEPVDGVTYAVKYADVWHRAMVVSTKPLGVFYIDYGNAEPPQSRDFRSLKTFPAYPPYAIRIRLADKLKVKVEDKLEVKMTSADKDGIVEVVARFSEPIVAKTAMKETSEPDKVEAAVPATKQAQVQRQTVAELPSVIDELNVDESGCIQVYMALNDKSYAVCVLGDDFQDQFQLVYEQLSIDCAQAERPAGFAPRIGDFVCGKRGDFWLRGHVFAIGPPMRLALVDEARISPVEEVLPMPEKYAGLRAFGANCALDDEGSRLEVEDIAQFKVVAAKEVDGERVVNATILESDRLNNVGFTLKKWKATPEQKGIAFAELEPNTEVCITAYSSERVLFVRSLDEKSSERTNRILQDVAKWAQTAPKLNGPPAIGQAVVAQYADGNFYRAIVTKTMEEKISVSYVDYGNREVTTSEKLRTLADELKEQRSCVAKVLLKDVKTDVLPTKEVHEYLDTLVGQEAPLFCTFEGSPFKDGVILTTATGQCINTRVNELLTPSTQRENGADDTKCFMLDAFQFAPLGEVGTVVKAIVLHATAPPFRYVMSPIDQEVISHISVAMPEKMREYCDATKEHYIPRVGELCLAVYFDQWYRGVCLERNNASDRVKIQFVDYGNVEDVEFKNIRPMTQEFFDVPGLGCICVVKNLGFESANGAVPANIMTRLAALVQTDTFIDIKILSHKDMEYEVELPEVKKTLIAEGLVKQ